MTASEPTPSTPPGEQLIIRLPSQATEWKEIGLWAGVLALLVLVVFFPATSGTLLPRDVDWVQFTPVPGAVSAAWSGKPVTPSYEPMTFSVYWLEYRLQGKPTNAEPVLSGFHLGALVFHAMASVLLWLILRDLRVPGSWLAAAIFAVHPIHAEAVSWIASQDSVIAGALGFGAIYCWMWFATCRDRDTADRANGGVGVDPAITWSVYAGGFLLAVLSVLSHPVGVIFPVMAMFALGWRRKLSSNDVLLLVIPGLTAAILWAVAASKSSFSPTVMQIIGVSGYGFWNGIRDLFVPFFMSPFHPAQKSMTGGIIIALAVFAPLAAAGIGFGFLRSRGIAAATAGFTLAVVFGLNWFNTRWGGAVSDASNYVSSAFLISLIVAVIAHYSPPIKQSMSPGLAGAIAALLVLSIIAWNRSSDVFQTPVSFWKSATDRDGDSTISQALYAEALREKSEREFAAGSRDAAETDNKRSIAAASRAVDLDPSNGPAQRTWAHALVDIGDVKQSLPHFRAAVTASPNNAELHVEGASALMMINDYNDAVRELSIAVDLAPAAEMPHQLLGQAWFSAGDSKRAIIEERTALKIASDNRADDPAARKVLGDALAATGDLNGALNEYQNALQGGRLTSPEVLVAIAKILDKQGHYREELLAYQAAAKSDQRSDYYKDAIREVSAKLSATTKPTTGPMTGPTTGTTAVSTTGPTTKRSPTSSPTPAATKP